jgi:hypothetical protein
MSGIPEKENDVTMETIGFGHPSASSKVTSMARNLEPFSHFVSTSFRLLQFYRFWLAF